MILVLLILISFLVILAVTLSILDNYRKHIVLFFYCFIQGFYLIFAPWMNYAFDDFEAFNVKLSEFDFTLGLVALLLHLLFFYFGYLISYTINGKKVFSAISRDSIDHKNITMAIYIFLFLLIGINAVMGEISLFDILAGKEDTATLGFKGGTNWISSMADSLILLMIMTTHYRAPFIFKVIFYPLTIFLFLILGFRYRFLLIIFGFVFLFLRKNYLKVKTVFRVLTLLIFAFYTFMFFSENRIQFYTGKYDDLKYNFTEFEYGSIHHNALGSIVDFALQKSFREDKNRYDFGVSMFVYPLIMVAPSSFFEGGEKPYPAPQIENIDAALEVPRSYGQACTFVGMSFNAYSWVGVILLSFIFGFQAFKLEFVNSSGLDLFYKLAVILSTFQLYTRGYLGLFLLPLSFMLLPLLIIKSKNLKFNGKATRP